MLLMECFAHDQLSLDDLNEIQANIYKYLVSIDEKAKLYDAKIPQKLVYAINDSYDSAIKILAMKILYTFIYNEHDLLILSTPNVIQVIMQNMYNSAINVQVEVFNLLYLLCQYAETYEILIHNYKIIETINTVSFHEQTEYFIQGFISFVYVFSSLNSLFYKKLYITPYLFYALQHIKSSDCKAVSLGMIYLLCQNKEYCVEISNGYIDYIVYQVLTYYMDEEAPSELAQIACNIVSTLCCTQPSLSEKFLLLKIPAYIYQICLKIYGNDDVLLSFAMSALIELIYAQRGQKNKNVSNMLSKIGYIDDVVEFFAGLMDRFSVKESDCYGAYGTILSILGDLPKQDDYIRISLLSRKVVPRILDALDSESTTAQTKIVLLNAITVLLKKGNLPPYLYISELPGCTQTVLRLKRNCATLKGNRYDKVIGIQVTEACKAVLEQLGHSEGRNTQKMQLFLMLFIGVVLIFVAILRAVIAKAY